MSAIVQAEASAVVGFDYTTLDPEAAGIVRDAAERIRAAFKRFSPEVGRELLRAKAVLAHGSFTAWAEAEFNFTGRTAERYMQAGRFLDGKPDTLSVLPATTLYALAAPDAPADLVQEVVAAAEAGIPLPAPVVKQRLDDARAEAKELRQERQRAGEPELSVAELRRRKQEKQRQREARARREKEHAEAQREREFRERTERLRPLADRILLTLDPADVSALAHAFSHWGEGQAMRDLLAKRMAS